MYLIPTILSIYLLFNQLYSIQKERYSKLLSQKKSGEVVLGQISEHIAPFLDDFPFKNDSKGLNFLGMPIDYVHFGKDKITFIEVKSGNSRLSKKQKDIKTLIESGKVDFITYRIK